jgi:hypothetical protein
MTTRMPTPIAMRGLSNLLAGGGGGVGVGVGVGGASPPMTTNTTGGGGVGGGGVGGGGVGGASVVIGRQPVAGTESELAGEMQFHWTTRGQMLANTRVDRALYEVASRSTLT